MSFWSREKLLRSDPETLIQPFDPKFAKHGAYELSLGSEVFITTEGRSTKQTLGAGEQLTIPPGQFGLLLTNEVVTIPNNAIGFISVRFKKKRRGLVNVSGFHVDPGFSGPLKFAVYNAGSQKIVLTRGERVFMIWFSDLSEATADVYKSTSPSLMEISSEDVESLQGEVASPAELKKQIEELRRDQEQQFSTLEDKMEQRFSTLDDKISTRTTIVAALLTALIVGVFFRACDQPSSNSLNQNTNHNTAVQEPNRSPEREINNNSSNNPNDTNIKPGTR